MNQTLAHLEVAQMVIELLFHYSLAIIYYYTMIPKTVSGRLSLGLFLQIY